MLVSVEQLALAVRVELALMDMEELVVAVAALLLLVALDQQSSPPPFTTLVEPVAQVERL